jgi:hypothetical protein
MDDLITRILEIEKQSDREIEGAEEACRKKIEVHRRTLEEEKERVNALITTSENTRLTQAIQDLKKRTEEESSAEIKKYEILFRDPDKIEIMKERIAAILLTE